MTPEEIKTLGHAFFDGKVLQFRPWEVDRRDGKAWVDWPETYCPDFDIHPEWRIKPDEPKKILCLGWFDGENLFMLKDGVAPKFPSKRIKELDREIALPSEGV